MTTETLIKNLEIDHQTSRYLDIYEQFGVISFEMTESEYRALAKITSSYREARKKHNFHREEWIEKAQGENLFSDDKSSFVFGFLSMRWGNNTHISVERDAEYVIVEIKDYRDYELST